jgi:hypothetical protein
LQVGSIRYLLILLTNICLCVGALPEEWKALTSHQQESIRASYEYGVPFDLGWTLAAIEWQESAGGKYLVNLQDPSAGAHHININTYMSRHRDEIEDTPFNRNVVAQWLIDSHILSCREAITELTYWKNERHNGSWSKTVRSYRAGNRWESPAGWQYYKSITARINFLKQEWKL